MPTDCGQRACYDCLMSDVNQQDHLLLNRHLVNNILRKPETPRSAFRRAPGAGANTWNT